MNKKFEQIIEGKSITKELYGATEIKKLMDQGKSEEWPMEWKKIYFKSYPRLPQILFEKPSTAALRRSLSDTLLKRSSNRDFHSFKITKDILSNFLFFSAGISGKAKNWDNTSRVYPSAGARYPSEVYLAVFNSNDLANGLYHYNVKIHTLELLLKRNLKKKLIEIIGQKWIEKASVIVIITSVLGRSEIKYKNRAYRFCLIEAGHLGQNIYLVSTALNLKCCAIGGFVDEDINSLLDFDDNNEFASYILAIGK